MSIETEHDLVLECLRQVTEQASERVAVQIEVILTFPDMVSEFWTTNPAPMTQIKHVGGLQ
jgi:Asp-tRNA(Asn)/Glu-tRNA(Gln) amidotransferase C subunit